MAGDRPLPPGRSGSIVLGATPTVDCASRSCRDGLTSAGDDCTGLRNSERGFREMAGGTVGLVVDSTLFRSGSGTLLRDSLVRGDEVPGAGANGFGATSGVRSPGDTDRPKPRLVGAIVVFLSASARAKRTTSELTSVSVLLRNSCWRRVISRGGTEACLGSCGRKTARVLPSPSKRSDLMSVPPWEFASRNVTLRISLRDTAAIAFAPGPMFTTIRSLDPPL